MGEICLSVAPILRCQSLTRLEAGILLLPPGIELVFACVLLWIKRGSADKKHVFLASEIYVYFVLGVFDLLTHTLPSIGSSLDSFRSLDIFIGVGSLIPLFLYTFALYLLTTSELVPSLPIRFQRIAKFTLFSFIPLIIILNELGSFVGITYRKFGGQDGVPLVLGVGFTNTTAEMFLSSVTLVLLTAFQAMNFLVAFYRLIKALFHQRSIDSTANEKEMEAHLFRGLGWIVIGLKLGAVETVIGFAQGGFAIAFTRRLLRLLGRACLVIGIVKGVDTVEDFQLYSPGEVQKRRKSALRAMIQNPRFSTFRHVGGHDFNAESAVVPKRESVIKIGDPSWMRRDFAKPLATVNEKAEEEIFMAPARKSSGILHKLTHVPSFRTSSRKSKGTASWRDSTSSFGSSRRNSWPPARVSEEDYREEARDVVPDEVLPVAVPRPQRTHGPQVRERVTVYIRQDRLPILQLRRLSNLDFLDLVTDTLRDPHVRAYSLPDAFEEYDGERPGKGSFTRLPAANASAPALVPLPTQPPVALPAEPRSPLPTSLPSNPRPPIPRTPPANPRPPSARMSVASGHSRAISADTLRPASVVSNATERPPSLATYKARDSGISFEAFAGPNPRASFASYNFRASVASYHPRTSVASYNPRTSVASYKTRASVAFSNPRDSVSTMSFHAIGSPSTSGVFSDAPTSIASTSASPRFGGVSRRDRGISSSTTASEVQAIASQFPGIPARPLALVPPVPRPRSMLSHEVRGTEFVVGEDAPVPAGATLIGGRMPSVKAKPAPVMEETEDASEPDTPKASASKAHPPPGAYAPISAQEATQSLPTPLSPPRANARWPVQRARTLSGKRRPPPLAAIVRPASSVEIEIETQSARSDGSSSASIDEAAVVRSASVVQRAALQGQLLRVKSVGSAPQRSVSAARRTAFARDSVQVELGHVVREAKAGGAPLEGARRGWEAVQGRRSREGSEMVRNGVYSAV
ncbi:hypothetical protein BD413DRAFT_612244 [Trametes elegans]|nr:hypothetical protein BD413DRAFT_612244 [Trametes elegans]